MAADQQLLERELRKYVRQIADRILRFGFCNTVLVDDHGQIIGTAFIGFPSGGPRRYVTCYTLRKYLIFLGCDGVTSSL